MSRNLPDLPGLGSTMRHDQAWAGALGAPCSHVIFPRRNRDHVAELVDGLTRPRDVLGLDAVAACVVRRWLHAVRQGHFETVAPYPVQVLAGRGRRPRRFRLRRAQPWREPLRHLSGFAHVHDAAVVVVAVGLNGVQPAIVRGRA